MKLINPINLISLIGPIWPIPPITPIPPFHKKSPSAVSFGAFPIMRKIIVYFTTILVVLLPCTRR